MQTPVQKFRKTKKGLITNIYSNQLMSSRQRGHSLPNYTLIEFREWVFKNKKFHIMFDNWEKSGYLKNLVPSCDRTDNSKGYDLDRLQIMTWREHNLKTWECRSNGEDGISKPVIGIEIRSGKEIKFHSITHAQRELNICHVSSCCLGERKSAGGYHWRFKT